MSGDSDSSIGDELTLSQKLDAIFEPHHKGDQPGFVVGVRLHGDMIYRRAFGLASVEHSVANTAKTRMRIGSTSKQFCALAVMLLVEDGKLNLDDGVNEVVPELPELDGYPTLRQLLNHTSGYRCTQELAYIAAGLAVQPEGQVLEGQIRQSTNNFSPGDGQLYCNSGYHLVSRIVERVSEKSFPAFLRDRIFVPAGLNETVALSSDMELLPNMATLHLPRPDGSLRRGILVNEETLGEGCIVSSLDDMMRWTAIVAGPDRPVGSSESWETLLGQTALPDGTKSTYGLGIWRSDYRGLEVINHAGGVIGGNSQMYVISEKKLEVFILTNTDAVQSSFLAPLVVDTLFDGELDEPLKRTPIDDFTHLAGRRYHAESGLVWGFDDVGGLLGVSLQLSPAAPVIYDFGDHLSTRFEELAMGPFRISKSDLAPDSDGNAPRELVIFESGRETLFSLMSNETFDTSLVSQRLSGSYSSADLDCEAGIWVDESLRMRFLGGYGVRDLDLEVISDSLVMVTARDPIAPYRFALTIMYNDDEVSGFHISTNRARGIEFKKTYQNEQETRS